LGNGDTITDAPSDGALYILQLSGNVQVGPSNCQAGVGDWFSQRSGKWILGNYGNTLYNHYFAPNASAWDCMNQPQQKAEMTARSNHPSGVNLLCCDGSTRFVNNQIDLVVWRSLATRDGGESEGGP